MERVVMTGAATGACGDPREMELRRVTPLRRGRMRSLRDADGASKAGAGRMCRADGELLVNAYGGEREDDRRRASCGCCGAKAGMDVNRMGDVRDVGGGSCSA